VRLHIDLQIPSDGGRDVTSHHTLACMFLSSVKGCGLCCLIICRRESTKVGRYLHPLNTFVVVSLWDEHFFTSLVD
jgi:hypothetical protein